MAQSLEEYLKIYQSYEQYKISFFGSEVNTLEDMIERKRVKTAQDTKSKSFNGENKEKSRSNSKIKRLSKSPMRLEHSKLKKNSFFNFFEDFVKDIKEDIEEEAVKEESGGSDSEGSEDDLPIDNLKEVHNTILQQQKLFEDIKNDRVNFFKTPLNPFDDTKIRPLPLRKPRKKSKSGKTKTSARILPKKNSGANLKTRQENSKSTLKYRQDPVFKRDPSPKLKKNTESETMLPKLKPAIKRPVELQGFEYEDQSILQGFKRPISSTFVAEKIPLRRRDDKIELKVVDFAFDIDRIRGNFKLDFRKLPPNAPPHLQKFRR